MRKKKLKEHPELLSAGLRETTIFSRVIPLKLIENYYRKWGKEHPEDNGVPMLPYLGYATKEETREVVLETAKRLAEENSVFSDIELRVEIYRHLLLNGFTFNDTIIDQEIKKALENKEIIKIGHLIYTTNKEIESEQKNNMLNKSKTGGTL